MSRERIETGGVLTRAIRCIGLDELSPPVRPPVVALLLACVAWPLVALSIDAVDTTTGVVFYGPAPAASQLARWSAAGSAVFISAIVAGTVVGPVARRMLVTGAVVAFVVALAVSIAALPLIPAVLGQHVGAGCYDYSGGPCNYASSTNDLLFSFESAGLFFVAPLIEPVPVIILALGVAVWSLVVNRAESLSAAIDSGSTVVLP